MEARGALPHCALIDLYGHCSGSRDESRRQSLHHLSLGVSVGRAGAGPRPCGLYKLVSGESLSESAPRPRVRVFDSRRWAHLRRRVCSRLPSIRGDKKPLGWERSSLSWTGASSFLNAEPCKSGPAWPHQVAGVAVVGMGIWMWVSSARDAPRAAERANDRHRLHTRTVTPIIEPFSGPTNSSKVGVLVHW
jgi:hypothetical protein